MPRDGGTYDSDNRKILDDAALQLYLQTFLSDFDRHLPTFAEVSSQEIKLRNAMESCFEV
jgi:hypothetical protein